MATDRYQRGLDRMMELVSAEHSNTFDHAKLVESYKSLDPDLAEYNLAATARILNLGAEHGVPAKDLFEVIGVSTGRSWMSDNFIDVQYDLLLKDVGLLRGELGSLPAADLDDEVEQAILEAHARLGSGSANE